MKIGVVCRDSWIAKYFIRLDIIKWMKAESKISLPIVCVDSDGNIYTFFTPNSNLRGSQFDQIISINGAYNHRMSDRIAYALFRSCVPEEFQVIEFDTNWER